MQRVCVCLSALVYGCGEVTFSQKSCVFFSCFFLKMWCLTHFKSNSNQKGITIVQSTKAKCRYTFLNNYHAILLYCYLYMVIKPYHQALLTPLTSKLYYYIHEFNMHVGSSEYYTGTLWIGTQLQLPLRCARPPLPHRPWPQQGHLVRIWQVRHQNPTMKIWLCRTSSS